MTDPSQDRICTLCHSRYTPERGVMVVGGGACIVVMVAVITLGEVIKPGVVLVIALSVGGALCCGGLVWWLIGARERTCTVCGSRLTVPLLSPAGVTLHVRQTWNGLQSTQAEADLAGRSLTP